MPKQAVWCVTRKSKIKARFFFKFKLAMSGKEICIYDRIISQFDNKKFCLLK